MASKYFIDLADDVKQIPNLNFDINFNRDIIIEAKKKIIEKVKKYRMGKVFWIDRSKLFYRNTEVATYWKDKNHNI